VGGELQLDRDEREDGRRLDPDNLLLGRMNRIRLEGEIIRDALLTVSGRLNRTVGGASVFPPLPPEVRLGAATWKARWRRPS
jgi:hypothetical protein